MEGGLHTHTHTHTQIRDRKVVAVESRYVDVTLYSTGLYV